MAFTRKDFPEDFIFGAATAAYQIEGSQFGGAGRSHWDTFAKGPHNVIRAEDGATACDHYNRFEEDLDIMKAGNFDAYRFSTSWSRVLPEGKGQINQTGLDFYDRLTDSILERGLKPFLTLYHWDLPAALADLGGWKNPDIHNWFGDFAEIIDQKIGDRMASIATINEPWCVSYLSHMLGHHAPGLRDIRAAARSMHHALKAHGEAITRLRSRGRDNLGIVLNFEYAHPKSNSKDDIKAAAIQDALYNRWFIEAMSKGCYPQEALAGLEPHLPEHWQDDLKTHIHQPLDWLGVNYYTRSLVAHASNDPCWPHLSTSNGPLPQTQMGWEIYPEGLEYFLSTLKENYIGELPIYVTENGMAWDDTLKNGHCDDALRKEFIHKHLEAQKESLRKGVNLKGFFYWSLLDNFEWAFGYEKRFGMVHVDFETQKRTPKDSFYMLQNMLER